MFSPAPMFLKATNLSKNYGNTPVLQDISLEIERGKCLALLGPSGCGKSTLLNILAGLLPADSGSISLDNQTIEDATTGFSSSPQQRRFAVVFQDLSLWPHLTVQQNVAMGLDYLQKSIPRSEKKGRIDNVLQLLGINDLRHRYPSMISGGQQQRVAIARAIVVEPAVLLMDEPLSSLDGKLREDLRSEIAALIHRLEITTVYVTHDFSEAMTVADDVAVMNKGRIEQCAPTDLIRHRPGTTFVASFLGINVIPYDYELEKLKGSDGEPLFPPHPHTTKRGFLLIPREDVTIHEQAKKTGVNHEGLIRWNARCIKNGFSDNRHEVHVRTSKGEVFRGFVNSPLQVDSPVTVEFNPRNVSFVET